MFLAWEEFPTSEVVLVYPIQEAQFPSVTLCPENSNPDRWGPVIKIFDNLKRTCLSERYEREVWFRDLHLILILTWSQKIKKCWSQLFSNQENLIFKSWFSDLHLKTLIWCLHLVWVSNPRRFLCLLMRESPTVCATPITVMRSIMGPFPLRNGVYLVTAIK